MQRGGRAEAVKGRLEGVDKVGGVAVVRGCVKALTDMGTWLYRWRTESGVAAMHVIHKLNSGVTALEGC